MADLLDSSRAGDGSRKTSTSADPARTDALVESARLLQSASDVDQLLAHLVRSAMASTLASRGFAAFDDGSGMRIRCARGIPAELQSSYDEQALTAAGIRRMLPLGQPDAPSGLLGVGGSSFGATAEQDEFLKALAGIASGAIENVKFRHDLERLNQTLDRRVHELRTLLDLVRNFTAVSEPEEVARMLALTLAGQWALQRYFVAAWREEQPAVIRGSRNMAVPDVSALQSAAAEGGDWIFTEELPDEPLGNHLRGQKIAALVPIRVGAKLIGVMGLGSPPARSFTAEELEYTRGLIDQAAVALDNAWNFRETLEKKKIEKELELAADIQRRLLPGSLPERDGIEVAAATRPARHVGGDYYDVLDLAGGEQLFCVADVSGKGVAASLLMSNFQASLRALALASMPLPEMVARMNDLMHASTASNKYVTALFAVVEPVSGRCRFVNAGHNDGVILRNNGQVERIKAGGLAVGLMPNRTYTQLDTELGAGDVVAMYSDGVTEANDPEENEFEIERLIELLREGSSYELPRLVSEIYTAVDTFAATAPQYDDITLMILRKRQLSAAVAVEDRE